MSPEIHSLKGGETGDKAATDIQQGLVSQESVQPENQRIFNMSNRGKALIATGLSTAALLGASKASAESYAMSPDGQDAVTTTVHVAKSESSAKAFAEARLVTNHRTVSKVRVRRAKRAGRCITVSGREAVRLGVYTQGHMGTGVGYAPENRKSTLCDGNKNGVIDNGDFRGECGNKIRIRKPKPELAKITQWMSKKAKVKVKAVARVHDVVECTTDNTYAKAEVWAKGKAVIRQRVRHFLKGRFKGRGGKIIQKAQLNAVDKARVNLKSKAEVMCQETTSEQPPAPPPEQPPEKPPEQPPEEKNFPPIVDLVDHQHNITGREVEVCAYGSDQDNDIVYRQMTESGDGNFVTNIYSGDEPGEFCRKFATGTSVGTAVITALVRDSEGNQASDTESWPIVSEEF